MSEEEKNQNTGYTKEEATKIAEEAVKRAMKESDVPNDDYGDTGLMDNYPYVPPQEDSLQQPNQNYPSNPYGQQQPYDQPYGQPPYELPSYGQQPYDVPQDKPQPVYDPRVDELAAQVEQGAKNNAVLNFNNGWNTLVNQNPALAEFNTRASKEITGMLNNGMITTPEKMAASFLGEKALADMNNPQPANVPPIPPSHANANADANMDQTKSFRDMTDEEFDEWESEHGNMKI